MNKRLSTFRYFMMAGVSLGAVACTTVPDTTEYIICDDTAPQADCPDDEYTVEVE